MDRIKEIEDQILKLKKELFELRQAQIQKEKEEKKNKKSKNAIDSGVSKVCSKCGIDRPLTDYRCRVPNELRADCVYCVGLRNKEYYNKNKEKNTKICECGAKVEIHYYKHHLKTKSHIKKIKMKEDHKEEPKEEPTEEKKEEIKN